MVIKLAGRRIKVETVHDSTLALCREYVDTVPGFVDFTVTTTAADIDYEREKSRREDQREGIPVRHFSDEYLETLAVYRKIAEVMPQYDTVLFHGSCVAMDGVGYLFTAKSGTGKSTHTRLWRERFGERAVMVNDDKPLIHISAGLATVYGTPWDGKHRLSRNIAVPLRAICLLDRDTENHIREIQYSEALPMLLQQVYRPADPTALVQTLTLLDKLGKTVKLYRLSCNMHPEAAQVAYAGMKGNKHETEA